MNEIEFLQQQIAVMQRRLSELKQVSKTYLLTKPSEHFDWIIEFDGGTSCNDPAKGFGNGYGSFLLKMVGQFQCVRTEWRSRDESVRLFGH